jgi:hypothetical protein
MREILFHVAKVAGFTGLATFLFFRILWPY